jgi:sugar lactone lactonase YvrE
VTFETLLQGERWGLLEAPRPAPGGGVLFSDVMNGGVFRLTPDGELTTVVERRRGIGGLVAHRDGGLVVSGRDVARATADGLETLLAPDGVVGFNDLTTGPDGDVLAGALRFHPFKGEDPVPGEVWSVRAGAPVAHGLLWANGLAVVDGTLYANDYARRALMRADGDAFEVLAEMPRGGADGLAADAEHHLWVALGDGAGIARVAPSGEVVEVVDVPAGFVSSLCFDGDTLYVTTIGALLRARTDVPGLPVAAAAV